LAATRERQIDIIAGENGRLLVTSGELNQEKFDWGSFEVDDVLGEGRCGKVFEGTLRGERVVI